MGNRYDLRGLEPLDGFPFPVFVSAGGTARGQAVAQRAARTVAWLDRVVGMPETPPLFVVGTGEWDQVASIPLYGMPHVESDRIVVGQEPAPFWDSVTGAITPLLAPAGLRRLHQVYGDPIDLGPFADLLVSHELTHLAHGPSWPEGPVAFWVKELAANLGLQGYVTEVEPSETTRLETIFEVTWARRRRATGRCGICLGWRSRSTTTVPTTSGSSSACRSSPDASGRWPAPPRSNASLMPCAGPRTTSRGAQSAEGAGSRSGAVGPRLATLRGLTDPPTTSTSSSKRATRADLPSPWHRHHRPPLRGATGPRRPVR
ncbi:hypothetical protein GCM10027614_79510 [Micromonospora vulcania]